MQRGIVVLILALVYSTSAFAKHHHHHKHHVVKTDDMPKALGHGLAHMLGNIAGLQHQFLYKLKEALAANPVPCHVGSGYRTHAEQARLYRSKPGLAAPPGHSNHERGLAADLSCRPGGLAWLHRNARKYGLNFPMRYEAWHIEPVGATHYARRHTRYAHRHLRHYAHIS